MDCSARIARNQDRRLSCSKLPGARFEELAGDGNALVPLAEYKAYLYPSALKPIDHHADATISQVEFEQQCPDGGKHFSRRRYEAQPPDGRRFPSLSLPSTMPLRSNRGPYIQR